VRDLFFGGRVWIYGAFEFELLGETQEIGGGGFGDAGGGAVRAELVEVAEDVAEDFKRRDGAGGRVAGVEQVFEREFVDARRQVFKFRVDFEAVEVADDEQRGFSSAS